MFVPNRGGGIGVAAAADENAASIAARPSTKTPSQLKTPKRRAFGDISNRKQPTTTTANIKPTPLVPITTKHKKLHQSSKIVPPSSSNRNRQVSFALEKPSVIPKETSLVTPHVEGSAGRTWSQQQQQEYQEEEDDEDIAEILAEQEAWESEVKAFCREEQTRHLEIRTAQQQAHDQQYQEKLDALWKQDDADLAVVGLLDDLVLESVPSFDDFSLGDDSLGPLDHDISF